VPGLRAIVFLWVLLPVCRGWGPEGHRLTARLAELHLEPQAAAAVAEILGPGRRLPDIANRADEVRNAQTAPWHFVNIPHHAAAYEPGRDCPRGDCIIAAIERFAQELADPNLRPEARFDALHNTVHFVGDLHQPLHCINRNDRGGNDLPVIFLGRRGNLHLVWDTELLRHLRSRPELQFDGLRRVSAANRRAWAEGTPETWALESHRLARSVAYGFGDAGTHTDVVLTSAYAQRAAPVLAQQLQKAGIRMATVLNNAFR
jgi:hypothetical protein